MKILILFIYLGFSLLNGQLLEELDDFKKLKKNFNIDPSFIEKNDGLWYNGIVDNLFTGRVIVYSRFDPENVKLAECTIVNGVKSGFLVQYYNKKHMVPGIKGLYVNGKKEGTWTWTFPDYSKYLNAWRDSESQIIISIEFRDNKRHGHITIDRASIEEEGVIKKYSYLRNDILLRGQYNESKKSGIWLFNEYQLSDFDELSEPYDVDMNPFYWSKKEVYDNAGNLAFDECREPWDKEIDCKPTTYKYINPKIFLYNDQKTVAEKIKKNIDNITYIPDDNGLQVQVTLKDFKNHIMKYHSKGTSVHKYKGSVFTINDSFRKMLKNLK